MPDGEANEIPPGPDAVALNDHVIRELFAVGLGLHGLAVVAQPEQRARITAYIDRLDATIGHIRSTVLDLTAGRSRADNVPAALVAAVTTVVSEALSGLASRANDVELRVGVTDDVITVELVDDGTLRLSAGGAHLVWTARVPDH